ncbi:MAG TPA: glycosyltransferase family 2 protein [Burkholderiaceae bacterium]|nr:glycosyltransferase family 2 protein [Burkholderiaceae bacterium]
MVTLSPMSVPKKTLDVGCRASSNGLRRITINEVLRMMFRGGNSRGFELPLVPVQDVEAADLQPNTTGIWIARSGRPEFEVVGLERFRGRWISMRFRLRVARDEWSAPRLSFNFGTGDFTEFEIPFPRATAASQEVELLFNVPDGIRSARLSPIAGPGRFELGAATVNVVGKPRAIGHMLRVIASVDGVGRAIGMLAGTIVPVTDPASRWKARHRIVRRYMEVRLGEKTYPNWIKTFESEHRSAAELAWERRGWRCTPTISVVLPVYNTPESFLRAAIDSILEQTYPNWELCVADDCSSNPHVRTILREYAERDPRIGVVYRETNGHISEASNSALSLATGDWIALLDHDDRLHPHALHFAAEAIAANPHVSLIYSDEDKIDENNNRYEPYFKCDYNYELLLAHNMICHLTILRRSLVNEIGGFRRGFEGAQDYDLALRAIEKVGSDKVLHLPRVLYHWRAHRGSTASSPDAKPYAAEAARRAIAEHLRRRGATGTVVAAPEGQGLHRVRYALPDPAPKVSIVICTRDRADLLAPCVDSIVGRSTYSNYEVVIVDNGSTEDETFRLFDRLPPERFRVLQDESVFNFSALNNRAVHATNGEYICLLNNDIEIVTADWIEEMLSFAMQPDVGAVGARLWYPGGGLQHAGVILGLGGIARHIHRNLKRGELGYFGRAALHQSFSAVTGAALMIKKSIYLQVGGLDEQFEVTFNDIDFCLRVREAGYRNVWTPYAEMIHHESATRGLETTPQKTAQAERESLLMASRWGDLLDKDPAYSLNLSIETEDLGIAWPPRTDAYQPRAPTSQRDRVALDCVAQRE